MSVNWQMIKLGDNVGKKNHLKKRKDDDNDRVQLTSLLTKQYRMATSSPCRHNTCKK